MRGHRIVHPGLRRLDTGPRGCIAFDNEPTSTPPIDTERAIRRAAREWLECVRDDPADLVFLRAIARTSPGGARRAIELLDAADCDPVKALMRLDEEEARAVAASDTMQADDSRRPRGVE